MAAQGHVTIPDTVAQKQLSTAIQIETNAEQVRCRALLDMPGPRQQDTHVYSVHGAQLLGLADGSTCSMHRQCQGKCGSSSQIYQSQAALIRKQTDALVNEINNNATIVTQTANSQAGLVDKTAEVPLTPILRLCMHAWPALCPVPRMRGADKASLTHATLELPYMTPMWLHTTGSLGVLAGCSPFLWLARAGLCPCDGVVCAQQWAGTAVQCIECHKRQVGLTS